MPISARNIIPGQITGLVQGPVNAEVEITTPGGDTLVAIVTEGSVETLGLTLGSPVTAYIKAPWVMVLNGHGDPHFSARNQFPGTVASLQKGSVNTEIGIRLPSGLTLYAIATNEAILELGLKEGTPASALIKASQIVLGVVG